MRSKKFFFALLFAIANIYALVNAQTVNVVCLNNSPFAYYDSADQANAGIEIEILNRFGEWYKTKHGKSLEYKFSFYQSFEEFYEAVKKSEPSTIGLGSVTITPSREKEINFSTPYLKNVMALVSAQSVPTLKELREISKNFEGKTALVISGSFYETEILNLKKNFYPKLKIQNVSSKEEFNNLISTNADYFGYMDVIDFWKLTRTAASLKMHRAATVDKLRFGFAFPKNSQYHTDFQEFMESGFGFTSTKTYQEILSNYLGKEIMVTVTLD